MASSSKKIIYGPPELLGDGDSDDEFFDYYNESRKTDVPVPKIVVVPHITENAGLNGEKFDSSLEPQIKAWFDHFEKTFKIYKKGVTLSQAFDSFYTSSANPYLFALKLYANCLDYNSPKTNSLPYAIMEELLNYRQRYKPDNVNLIDDNLRMVAFNFVKKYGQQSLVQIVIKAFDLINRKDLFVDKVQELVKDHMYKEACQIAQELELYDEFTIFDFIFPLILQDKINIAEEYLNRAVVHQRPTVELLDSLMNKSNSVRNACGHYIAQYDYTDVNMSKIHAKPLTKLVVRLAKSYNIPKEAMPNVHKSKIYGALQFLVHKNYVEKSLNRESWREMVKETVNPDETELHQDLVYSCHVYNDLSEAIYWAEYFNLPLGQLHIDVQNYAKTRQGSNEQSVNIEDENWDDDSPTGTKDNNDIFTLSLPESNIILVDTSDKFNQMLNYLRSQELIAFDSEWKPTFLSMNDVALIQFATIERIFLVDVVTLGVNSQFWNRLGRYVFNNEEILKLAFAPATDITMLIKSIPTLNLSQSAHSLSAYFDLQEFWRKLNLLDGFQFPFKPSESAETLSNLIFSCFGKKLDKTNQFSNWQRRPLRKDQIYYAALDSYCLLELYFKIKTLMNSTGVDVDGFINKFLLDSKSKVILRKKHNNQTVQNQGNSSNDLDMSLPPGPNVRTVGVTDVNFICDSMLGGLTKCLRQCGISAIQLTVSQSNDDLIKMAVNENRYVLTRGTNLYRKYSQYIPMGHCLPIKSDIVENQILEVLDYFNISVKSNNVFSRCQICNCDHFILMDRVQINNLKDGNSQTTLTEDKILIQRLMESKTWHLSLATWNILNSSKTNQGTHIKVNQLPAGVLDTIEFFFICDKCGKIYWDGTHLNNTLTNRVMQTILTRNMFIPTTKSQ